MEHVAQFGALFTDFNMIKPGALHAANGGFLVLEARDVLTKPYAWDALKRTLKNGEIRIEDVAQQIGMTTTSTLDPEPVPFTAKVVLIGEAEIYHLLFSLDPDFPELFKVKADFDTVVDRTAATEHSYARFVAQVCRTERLPPFTPAGVARVIEHALAHGRRPDKAQHPPLQHRRPGAGVGLLGRARATESRSTQPP